MLHLINDLLSFLLVADRDYRFETLWFDVVVVVFTTFSCFITDQKRRFIFLSLLQLSVFLLASPWIGNHILPHAYISAIGLVYLAINKFKRRPSEIEKDLFPQFFVIFACFYFFTTFYKLNFGFFDPQESCSVYVVERIFRKLHFGSLSWLAPAMLLVPITFVFEGFFPALTKNRYWRPRALLAIIAFHVLLSIHYFEFLPLVLVLMTQIMNPKEQEMLKKKWSQFFGPHRKKAIVLVIFVAFKAQLFPEAVAIIGEPVFGLLGLALGIWIALPFILVLKQAPMNAEMPKHKVNGYGIAFAVLMVISGLGPFMGSRTIGTLGMYSNLRTEGANNHFLMPNLNLFSEKDDLVQVKGKAGRFLKVIMPYWVIPEGEVFEIPRFELARALSRMTSEQQNMMRPNVYYKNGSIEELVQYYEGSPLYKKIFFGFHPVSFYEMNACTW